MIPDLLFMHGIVDWCGVALGPILVFSCNFFTFVIFRILHFVRFNFHEIFHELSENFFHCLRISNEIVFQPIGDFTGGFGIKLHEDFCGAWRNITFARYNKVFNCFALGRENCIFVGAVDGSVKQCEITKCIAIKIVI
ncbi:hypothetical protein SDC9_114863 [bioreactor metagenome]|uniref:Uncharacterized protein n=1 Tax=bioreactor metagenome TaxID=1076179 RepID=A0A645BS75_9ZZZZ